MYEYFQDIDVCVKWPNDIYVDGSVKVGGLIVNSIIEGNTAICNIGKLFFKYNY